MGFDRSSNACFGLTIIIGVLALSASGARLDQSACSKYLGVSFCYYIGKNADNMKSFFEWPRYDDSPKAIPLKIFDKCGYSLQVVERSSGSETSNSVPSLGSVSNRDQLHINVNSLSLSIKIDVKDFEFVFQHNASDCWLADWYSVNQSNKNVCSADIQEASKIRYELLKNHSLDSLCFLEISTIADRQHWEKLDNVSAYVFLLEHLQPSNTDNINEFDKHALTNTWRLKISIAIFLALVVRMVIGLLKTVNFRPYRGQLYQEVTIIESQSNEVLRKTVTSFITRLPSRCNIQRVKTVNEAPPGTGVIVVPCMQQTRIVEDVREVFNVLQPQLIAASAAARAQFNNSKLLVIFINVECHRLDDSVPDYSSFSSLYEFISSGWTIFAVVCHASSSTVYSSAECPSNERCFQQFARALQCRPGQQ